MTLTTTAINEVLARESSATFINLLTFSGAGVAGVHRIADNWLQRISTTADEVVYGVISRTQPFEYVPLNVIMPDSKPDSTPVIQLTIQDPTGELIPILRQFTEPPTVLVETVLSTTPNVLEQLPITFRMVGFTYDENQIASELTLRSLSQEQFPAHSFTPSYFPGLF